MLGRLLPGQDTPDLSGEEAAVAALFAAAAAPAEPAELAAEQHALALFRAARDAGVSTTPRRRSRRKTMLTQLLSAKLLAVLAGGTVTLGGAAAAAYTGAFPTPVQDFAHTVIGAPAPDQSTAPTASPTPATGDDEVAATASPTDSLSATPSAHVAAGPDAAGPAAFGLCTAYAHGHSPKTSVAFQRLADAAGGAAHIATYCAGVAHPGSSEPTATPTAAVSEAGAPAQTEDQPTGAPTSRPTQAEDHPTGAPTSRPTQAQQQSAQSSTHGSQGAGHGADVDGHGHSGH